MCTRFGKITYSFFMCRTGSSPFDVLAAKEDGSSLTAPNPDFGV
jgi:hypothetical protein